MMKEIEIEISQWARKSGGDKYTGTTENNEQFVPYIPQSFSRHNGKKVKRFKCILEPIEYAE